MNHDWYELIGQTPVRIQGDILECARRFETMERRVALTTLFDMCTVSTVFLGLDHGFRGPPLLFETMAFWHGEGAVEQLRCSTWPQAEKQHARMCAECVRPGAVLRYVGRRFRDHWREAISDLGLRKGA